MCFLQRSTFLPSCTCWLLFRSIPKPRPVCWHPWREKTFGISWFILRYVSKGAIVQKPQLIHNTIHMANPHLWSINTQGRRTCINTICKPIQCDDMGGQKKLVSIAFRYSHHLTPGGNLRETDREYEWASRIRVIFYDCSHPKSPLRKPFPPESFFSASATKAFACMRKSWSQSGGG